MTTLYLYIMAASNNPDGVECLVPYPISRDEIFFGPCKRLLRKELRDQYLKTSDDVCPTEDVFVVGVNGSNSERCRKIVWAGRITRLTTFEFAHKELTDSKYQEMRGREDSPLHVRPLYDDSGRFSGYEHCSIMHKKNDGWVRDLTHSKNTRVRREGSRLLLVSGANRHQAFPRDCCFLLERIFFAQGAGIPISGDMLAILREAQPGRQIIDEYAIFGYRVDGGADGRAGRWLKILGEGAKELARLIRSSIPATGSIPWVAKKPQLKSCSCR